MLSNFLGILYQLKLLAFLGLFPPRSRKLKSYGSKKIGCPLGIRGDRAHRKELGSLSKNANKKLVDRAYKSKNSLLGRPKFSRLPVL